MKKFVFSLFISLFILNSSLFCADKKTSTPIGTVSLIRAILLDNMKIKIDWDGLTNNGIQYLVYRSTNFLNSPEKLDVNYLIQTLLNNETSFTDTVSKPGEYYYAITVLTKDNNEIKTLIPEQNFIVTPIKIGVEKIVSVQGIDVQLVNKNALINWQNANINADSFNIYRNTSTISNKAILKESLLIENIGPQVQSYTDQSIPSGLSYYYAIINVKNGKEQFLFIPNGNYNTNPLENNQITPITKNTEEQKPIETPNVEANTNTVVKVQIPIKKKVVVKKKIVEPNYTNKLNFILEQYFYKNNFNKAISELKNFLFSKASIGLRNKAKLYLGKSYYNIGYYKTAIKYFIDIKDIYPEESDFWIKNSLNKL